MELKSLGLEFHKRKSRNQKTWVPRVFTNNQRNNKNTNINKRSKHKPHKARDQNKNHKHLERSKTETRSNKPTNLMANPRTQALTKPTNPDLPNPNPLAWTKPRQQRLQAKDLCRGFLLLQGKVSFSSVSFFLSFFLFIFYFLFFVEQKLESLILKFHTTSWKSWGHLLPLFKQ